MNCSHSGDGWCLDCVSELQRDKDRLDFLATCNEGWPVVEEIKHRHGKGSLDVYYFIAEVMPDEWEPNGTPVQPTKMQEAFRELIDEAINESIAFGESA